MTSAPGFVCELASRADHSDLLHLQVVLSPCCTSIKSETHRPHMSDTADILNRLIEIAKDGEQGFKTAAEKVKNPSIKTLFESTRRNARAMQPNSKKP